MTLFHGKLDPDPTKPALRLAPHLTGAPTTPEQRDWLSKVGSWPMYGNDQYGDCVWAAIGHAIIAWTTYAGSPVEVSLEALLQGYADVTGFNRDDPATDQGTVMQDALSYWRKTGVAGHRILAFAKVDHTDPAAMKAAIDVFGSLQVGIKFPRVAMTQFNAGKPWALVRKDGGIEGGHAIHAGAFDPRQYRATTWGRVQSMLPDFAAVYIDEAWAVITPEWLTAAGTTPSGVDLHGLGEELAALTGEPNPFPVSPLPVPVPPVPGPVPAPVGPEAAALAAVLREQGWVDRPHAGYSARLAGAARAWLTAVGL
jgi:hypothetical protein